MKGSCDPLALTTAVNTLAVTLAAGLDDQALALAAAVLTQLGDTLATIAVQRELCSRQAAPSSFPCSPESGAYVSGPV